MTTIATATERIHDETLASSRGEALAEMIALTEPWRERVFKTIRVGTIFIDPEGDLCMRIAETSTEPPDNTVVVQGESSGGIFWLNELQRVVVPSNDDVCRFFNGEVCNG